MSWFWLFMCVFWICETVMYLKGHDTMLFEHKTRAEKQIQWHQSQPKERE